MQQVQFLQQVRAANNQAESKKESRFKDDYKPFRMCKQFSQGECFQGDRCIYAHSFQELHPASPDLPKNEQGSVDALSEMKPQPQQEESAPNMRLRKKRDLCKKFMDTRTCL